jgi:hypothetical protein
MKYSEIHIKITNPCHEDWNKMTTTESGKFCKACTKEVIDFTAKSDEEIIKHYGHYGNVCGRFHPSQLNRKLIADRKKRNHWLSYAASLLLPITLFSQETTSTPKNNPQTTQTENTNFTSLQISSLARKKEKITISGIVTDSTGTKIPNAYAYVKDTHIGVTTDMNGFFMLKAQVNDTLEISQGYFETKLVTVRATSRTYNVVLFMKEPEPPMILGGAVAVGCYIGDDYYKSPMTEEEIKARDERTKNYFAFQRKKWLKKRAKRREKRAARKAKQNEKRN